MSEGCTFSYECDDAVAAGGRYFDCTEVTKHGVVSYDGESNYTRTSQGRVVFLDFETGRYSCIDDVDTCPGGQISGVGCPVPECQIGKNNLGTCECDSQFFINADCTEGFVCTSNIPDPYLYDGCLQTCNRGEILVPDFAEKTWQCLDNDPSVSRCNGAFNLECPQNDIGTEFNSTMCECDGQLLVDHDCRNGFYCFSLMGDGGWNITCPEGQIIVTDTRTWNWGCEEDNGQCPGLGGYKFGCREGNPDPPQLLECNFARNPFGECECVNEFFISEDCSTSFFCSEYRPSPDVDGCLLQCADGQTVKLDPTTFTWTCVPRNESFICPGEFKLDCTNTFDVHCNCENEVWMNGDCTQAAVCTAPEAEDGSNALRTVSCPDDQILDIDFYDFTPGQYQCTEDVTQCPGSFHFGCQGLDLPDDGSEDNGGPVLGSTLMLVTSLTLLSLDI